MVAPAYTMVTLRKDYNDEDDEESDQIGAIMRAEQDHDDNDDEGKESSSSFDHSHTTTNNRRSAYAIGCSSFVIGFFLGALIMFVAGYKPFHDGSGGQTNQLPAMDESVYGSTTINNSEQSNEIDSIQTSVTEATMSDNINEEGEDTEDEPIQNTISANFSVSEQVNHDRTSFTQGLSYGNDGMIYETTGLYGQSKVRRINPRTFEVELSVDIDEQFFGEGSAYYLDADGNGRLIQITWQEQTGFIYDTEALQKVHEFNFTTTPPSHEGWGITYDASNQEFIVSDGSKFLYFWDRDTLVEKRKVEVTRLDGNYQDRLNELEYMDGIVCCNIWYSDEIICVDPTTGKSVREYDMSYLWPQDERDGADVLNGIALGNDHVLITGKLWDRMFKVTFPDWPSLFDSSADAVNDETNNTGSHDNSIDNEDTTAVSYNFLRTTKGTETMRLLLNDLLSSPQQQTTSTNNDGYLSLYGPRRSLTHLSELMKNDGQILSSCHPLAHNLGRVAYQFFGSMDGAFDGMVGTEDAHLLRLCNAAFLHGVIEYHLRDSSLENLVAVAGEIEDKVCSKLVNVDSGPWECHHGIGHGIVQRYRMEGEKAVIEKSQKSCRETSAASECENGMWMDHFAVSGNILAMETRMMASDIVLEELKRALSTLGVEQTSIEGRIRPPPFPQSMQICNSSLSAFDCFIYAATEYLLVHPRDYAGAIKYCTDPSANIGMSGLQICVEGVGTQCAKENMKNFSVVEEVCRTLDDQQSASCFQAALTYFRTSTENESPKDAGLCDNLIQFKQMCLNS